MHWAAIDILSESRIHDLLQEADERRLARTARAPSRSEDGPAFPDEVVPSEIGEGRASTRAIPAEQQ